MIKRIMHDFLTLAELGEAVHTSFSSPAHDYVNASKHEFVNLYKYFFTMMSRTVSAYHILLSYQTRLSVTKTLYIASKLYENQSVLIINYSLCLRNHMQ